VCSLCSDSGALTWSRLRVASSDARIVTPEKGGGFAFPGRTGRGGVFCGRVEHLYILSGTLYRGFSTGTGLGNVSLVNMSSVTKVRIVTKLRNVTYRKIK